MFCPFFFVFGKNEISVQKECVATTENVVKSGDWGLHQQAILRESVRDGIGQKE